MTSEYLPFDDENFAHKRRGFRVVTVILAIVLFNIADLLITLEYRKLNLLIESNEVARLVVYDISPAPMILYKIIVTFIGCGLLIKFKNRISSEIACWFILSVLVLVIAKWSLYIEAITMVQPHLPHNSEDLRVFIESQ